MERSERNGSDFNPHPAHAPRRLAWAVALAVAGLAGEPAFGACGSAGTTTISGASTGPCTLVAGSVLKVTSTGILTSTTAGASADHVSGPLQILNAGTINGATAIALTRSTLTGGISNYSNGTLTGTGSNGTAVLISATRLSGSVINNGTVSGTGEGIALYGSTLKGIVHNRGTLTLEGGMIRGPDLPQAALGVHNNSVISGLYNTGSITSSDRLAVQVDTSTVGSRGIKNAGGTLSGSTGLFIDNSTVTGAVANTGSIRGIGNTGEVGDGDGLRVRASQLAGGLSNSGSISAIAVAISFDNSGLVGNLSNSGQLSGVHGIRLEDSQLTGSLLNSGSVNADGYGVALQSSSASGDISNSGTVFGSDRGVSVSSSTVDGTLRNSGTLSAHEIALLVSGSTIKGGIVNTGRIEAPAGVQLGNSRITSIDNRGVIQGGDDGVLTLGSVQISGDINNSGSLLAESTSPFTLLLVDSQLGGRLASSGTISGQNGINLRNSSIAGGMDISGKVLADPISGFAVDIDAGSSVPQLRINGNDSAQFSGAVRTVATPVLVTTGSTFTLQDGNRFEVPTFTNQGTLAVAAQGADRDDPSAPPHAAIATIQGNYLQASGATFSTRVADASSYGQLVVSGTATLPHQANLFVNVANPAQPFSVASLNNVISAGTLASDGTYNVTSNSQLFTFSGVKDGNTLDLNLAPKSATGVSAAVQGNSAALGAARVLDSQLAANNALASYFVSATSSAEVARAVSQSLPLTNSLPASQFMQEQIVDTLRERLAEAPMLAPGFAQPQSSIWIKPFGARMNDNQRSALNASVGGTLFGADALLSNTTRIGVAFAYGTSQAADDGPTAGHNNQLELYQFTGYGSHLLDDVTELSVHVGMGHNQSDGRRSLDFGGSSGQADATVASQIFSSGVALSRRVPLSAATTVTPSLSADYTRVHDEAYRESGSSAIAPLLLDVKARSTDQMLLGFDTRISHDLAPGMQVKGKLGVAYDVLDQGNAVTAAFAGAPGQAFTTPGNDLGPWVLRGGLEFASVSHSGTSVAFAMDMQTRAGYSEQVGTVRLNVPF
jgi:uncharacterized protein with beta-barrel porin domain